MTRQELEHVLRAAAAITLEDCFVVVGSQSILLPYPDAPAQLCVSREVDLYPSMAPEKAELIEGAIGALSRFDETFGYYADGVGPETAVMPADWMERAGLHYVDRLTAICPEPHDLALSKAVAARDKDADFVRCLLQHALIDGPTLLDRSAKLDPARCSLPVVQAWIRRRIAEVAAP